MHLIVGVDPGMTKGIAALDLEGRVVGLFSGKDLGLDAVIRHLISLGTVSVIATDVNPAPDFVLKLAAQLGSVVYVPEESVSVQEKMALTRGTKTEDMHQRDSLAAALIAFNSYTNKFRKIDSMGLGPDAEKVKHLVVRGMPITEAQRKASGVAEEPQAKEEKPSRNEVAAPSAEERRVKMLERQNQALRDRLAGFEKELDGLRLAFSRMRSSYEIGLRKDSGIRGRELSIKTFKHNIFVLEKRVKELEGLKNAWQMLLKKEIHPIGVFPEQKKGLVFLGKRPDKEDLELLRSCEIVFVQERGLLEYLRGKGIAAADSSKVSDLDGCFFISSKDLDAVKQSFKAQASAFSIEDIVSGYRRQRV